ncbi:MAG: hypothetical protein ABSB28_06660 [Candidatus Bathyarchaeia archaeon]
MPFLTRQDEEFQMLLEVAEEYLRQKCGDTPQNKSGNATETVIRNHLLKRGFNMTLNPNVKIQGSNTRIDSLLLKPSVISSKLIYAPNEVSTVIEIKNNAVANQSKIIKENFDKLSRISENFRFAVIVLSERKGYTHEITEEKLENKKYRVFTLVSRKKYPKGGLYRKEAILEMMNNNEMMKTRKWEELLAHLKLV